MKRSLLDSAAVAALFIGALSVYLKLAGFSPIAWLDTFNDQAEVQQCLLGSCTLAGVATSVPGQVHAVAWLELRTLLALLGVGFDGVHVLVQVLNAVAVVLVFVLAARLGGRIAGAVAVWILVVGIGPLTVRTTALYNTSPLLFLGAVFVLACTAAVERPGVTSVALAALVGAVMANIHLACVLTGASVVWVALLAPRRPIGLAVLGAVLFTGATVAVAPPTWLHDLASLLQHSGHSGGAVGVRTPQGPEFLFWTLVSVAAWTSSLVSRDPTWIAYRRRAQGALAVVVPFVVAFLLGSCFGLDANPKYLAHAKAACAVAAALPLGVIATAFLRRPSMRWLLVPAEYLLPFAVALIIARTAVEVPADDEQTPTMGDLSAAARILHDEHGWDLVQTLRQLKTPFGVAVLTGFEQQRAMYKRPSRRTADGGEGALLMMLGADELPDPLPPNWEIVRRSARRAAVLIFTSPRIDWSSFVVCTQPADDDVQLCQQSTLGLDDTASMFTVPHMPPAGLRTRGTLTLRLPLRAAAAGADDEVFMPRMQHVCGGIITTVSTGGLRVDAHRRHATLSASETGGAIPSTIDLEWQIGAPECDGWAYDGLPPFVIEGDAATVRLLQAILQRKES